jgi:hypothetical protein
LKEDSKVGKLKEDGIMLRGRTEVSDNQGRKIKTYKHSQWNFNFYLRGRNLQT